MSCNIKIKNKQVVSVRQEGKPSQAFRDIVKNLPEDYRDQALSDPVLLDLMNREIIPDNKRGIALGLYSKLKTKNFQEWYGSQSLNENDKIVFGHPLIGKSFLKQKKDNRFISLDDDIKYVTKIEKGRKKIIKNYPTKKLTKYEIQNSSGTEQWHLDFKELMQNVYEEAKKDAKEANKTLILSNTELLKNNINDFDRIINIPTKTFIDRVKRTRPDSKYNLNEWKDSINSVIKTVNSTKIITTNNYLSDLIETSKEPTIKEDLLITNSEGDIKSLWNRGTFIKGVKLDKSAFDETQNDNGIYYSLGKGRSVDFKLKVIQALDKLLMSNSKANKKGYTERKPVQTTIRLKNTLQRLKFKNSLKRQNIPKDQIELLFDFLDNNGITEIKTADLINEFVNSLVFDVSVNMSVTNIKSDVHGSFIDFRVGNTFYSFNQGIEGWYKEDAQQNKIKATEEEIILINKASNDNASITSNFYENLASLDEYKDNPNYEYQELTVNVPFDTIATGHFATEDKSGASTIGHIRGYRNKKDNSFVVIEFQSDLFQKNRDANYLTAKNKLKTDFSHTSYEDRLEIAKEMLITGEFTQQEYNEFTTKLSQEQQNVNRIDNEIKSENQFLQLLNKDGRWVRFFTQAIIQQASKAGRTKVLFPTGETAAKVEGHQTLETEIKKNEDRIKSLKDENLNLRNQDPFSFAVSSTNKTLNSAADVLVNYPDDKISLKTVNYFWDKIENENKKRIKKLESRIQHLENAGIEQLKPIEAFYQNRVGNILKKDYKGRVTEVKDEFGYGFREVDIRGVNTEIYLSEETADQKQENFDNILQYLKETVFDKAGITIKSLQDYKDWLERNGKLPISEQAVALVDVMNSIVALTEGNNAAAFEEAGHIIVLTMGPSLKGIENTALYHKNAPRYREVYKGTTEEVELKVREEIMGQLVGLELANRYDEKDGSLRSYIRKLINRFIELFKPYKKEIRKSIERFEKLEKVELQGDEIFYHLREANNLKELLSESVKDLTKFRKKRERELDKKDKKMENIISTISSDIDSDMTLVGLSRLVEYMVEDSTAVVDTFKDKSVSLKELEHIQGFLTYYSPYLQAMKRFESDEQLLYKNNIETFRAVKKLDALMDVIGNIHRRATKQLTDRTYSKYAGKTSGGYTVEMPSDKIEEDIWGISYFTGSAQTSSSIDARLIDKKTFDAEQERNRKVLKMGQKLLKKVKELSIKNFKFAIERDANGKKTGNIIQEFNNQEVENLLNRKKSDLAKKFGLSAWNAYEEIDTLSSIQRKAYYREYFQYENSLTKLRPDFLEFYKNLEKTLTKEQFDLVKEANTFERNGVIDFQGIFREPLDKFKNKEYAKLSDNEKEFIRYYIETKEKLDSIIPGTQKSHKLPQIEESALDIIKSGSNIFKRLGYSITSSFVRKADDIEYGASTEHTRPDGTKATIVPTFYNKSLENKDALSEDIVASLIQYANMAHNYAEKSKILPEIMAIANGYKYKTYKDSKGEVGIGTETNMYKQVAKYIERNFSGIKTNEIKTKILGKEVNVSKILRKFESYVSTSNLVFNFFSTTSGMISGGISGALGDIVDRYTDPATKASAIKEFTKLMPGAISESGAPIKNNKLNLMMEYFGITIPEVDNLDKGRLIRNMVKMPWGSWQVAGYATGGLTLISVLKSNRYDGKKWITKEDNNPNWKDLDTAYDMITSENGSLKLDKRLDKETVNLLSGISQSLNNNYEGQISELDKSAIHQNVITALATTHRGWLIDGVSKRFKKKGLNFLTNKIDVGYYRGTWDFLTRTVLSKENMFSLKYSIEVWDKLGIEDRIAVKKTMLEMSTVMVLGFFVGLLNAMADDEEDWNINAMAYLGNRVLLELQPFVPIAASYNDGFKAGLPIGDEFLAIFNKPFVGARHLELGIDFMSLFSGDEIDRGPYKGYKRWQKQWGKLIPGINGLMAARDPKSSNQYIKNKPLKWLYKE